MRSNPLKTLEVTTVAQWRTWLARHHDSETEVWLVFRKQHTGRASISYEDAVDEALCVGWIDSLIRRLDDERYARKFTPRKADSRWSTANRRRYSRLAAAGRLKPTGLTRAPTGRSGDAPRPSPGKTPRYILRAIDANPKASRFFDSLAPSYRRLYIGWIDSARKADTKTKRLREAVRRLAAGEKLGLK